MNPFARDYAKFLDQSSWYKHAGQGDAGEAAYLALGLTGESGEYADQIKKMVRRVGFAEPEDFGTEVEVHKEKLVLEASDVGWYLVKTCTFLGITIEELFILNTVKLYARLERDEEAGTLPIEMPAWPFTTPSRYMAQQLWERVFESEAP